MERVNLPSKILISKLIFLAGELFSQDRCQMKRVKSYGKFCFVVEVRQITPHAVLESPQLQDAPVNDHVARDYAPSSRKCGQLIYKVLPKI